MQGTKPLHGNIFRQRYLHMCCMQALGTDMTVACAARQFGSAAGHLHLTQSCASAPYGALSRSLCWCSSSALVGFWLSGPASGSLQGPMTLATPSYLPCSTPAANRCSSCNFQHANMLQSLLQVLDEMLSCRSCSFNLAQACRHHISLWT